MNRCVLILAITLLPMTTQAMQLASPDFANGGALALSQVKCGGGNVSPALNWSGEPASTKSFAVTVFDRDAHGGWWHWIVFDIPATTHALASGAGSGSDLPQGAVEGSNDFHEPSYDGPCPPPGSGEHHYEFTLWALPIAHAPLDANATGGQVLDYLQSRATVRTWLVGTYER
jgi:Raf kinase inhibitor-like YbhB/YbcL family protein